MLDEDGTDPEGGLDANPPDGSLLDEDGNDPDLEVLSPFSHQRNARSWRPGQYDLATMAHRHRNMVEDYCFLMKRLPNHELALERLGLSELQWSTILRQTKSSSKTNVRPYLKGNTGEHRASTRL